GRLLRDVRQDDGGRRVYRVDVGRGQVNIDHGIDAYFGHKKCIHEAYGYRQDWVEIPMEDARQMFWMIVGGEGVGGHVVWSGEPLTVDSIRNGDKIFSGPVYTQRFCRSGFTARIRTCSRP
ncbi:MAG: hypothetical protein LUO93_00625, partial [Methanomicrobiales archaeon]|nr:hypothetical protein [Methanomicrobiales archaeon]